MNAAADVNGLIALLRRLTPCRVSVARLSAAECMAAMRDLGLLLGSIKRWGVEPVNVVPELDARLVELGARTEMVPRDTVLHYTWWNPVGDLERMYTGHPMERTLISGVRPALPPLCEVVEKCRQLVALDPVQEDFLSGAIELVPLVASVEKAIDRVASSVTPEFFAHTLRPYFTEVRVGGTDYLGPSAAHIPLYLIDLALWASDRGGEPYAEFCGTSVRFGLPSWRQLALHWTHEPSTATKVVNALIRHGDAKPHLCAGARALCGALRALVIFRGRHLSLARRAYAEEIRLYPLGSGGGSVELLEEVTTLTRDIAHFVQTSAGISCPTTCRAAR